MGDQTIRYGYDPTSRRIFRETAEEKLLFLWQQEQEIGAYTQGQQTQLRILDDEGTTVAIELNQKLYVPIQDPLGHVRALLDGETGSCVATYRYSAFGEEELTGISSPWRYAGKRIDEDTGLIHFGARDYDPASLCWLTPDPLAEADGFNLYAYVHHNPLLYIDPNGCFSLFSWIGENPYVASAIVTCVGTATMVGWGMMGLVEGVVAGCADGVTMTGVGLAADAVQFAANGGMAACEGMETAGYVYNIAKVTGKVVGAICSCTPAGRVASVAIQNPGY